MRKGSVLFLVFILGFSSGCKKKENNIINQAYREPLKTYRETKKKIKSIEKQHLERLKSLEDSLR